MIACPKRKYNIKDTKVPKNERRTLVKKLDTIFSKYIRIRDKKSVLSGSMENLTCSHIFSRVSYSTRWDEQNAFAMTAGENLRHEYDSYYINEWFIRMFGKDEFDKLHAKWSMTTKFSNGDLKLMIMYYQTKISELEG
jgi:hypothetical protein